MEEDQSTMMRTSKRKEKQLAQHAAKTLQWQDKMKPYNTCEVKRYWDDLFGIEACQYLYGEVGRESKQVVSFSPWEKALLEFLFLATHAWPIHMRETPSDICQDLAPGLILNIESKCQELKHVVRKFAEEDRDVMLFLFSLEYMLYSSRLTHYPQDMQELIVSIGVDENERSRMAQKEAEAVLEKFKFGHGFSLRSSCVEVITVLVLKRVKGDGMEFTYAVDTLPLPELVMNMIDPIMPLHFDSARCPIYKLIASFARGDWLNGILVEQAGETQN